MRREPLVWAARAAENPSGRIVDENEIASVVGFLAGAEASAVNGEAITVALGSHW